MDIDNITLKYLSNLKNKNNSLQKLIVNEDDIYFYKHRIQNLTYELLNNVELVNIDTELKQSFNIYVNSCINYFKLTDTHMILQKDHGLRMDTIIEAYDDDDENSNNTKDNENVNYHSNPNPNPNPVKQLNYMDKFIIRNKIKKTQLLPNIIIPKQKEMNIKTTDFRYKIDIPTILDNNSPSLDIILPQDSVLINE
jgi:hypothetical protein